MNKIKTKQCLKMIIVGAALGLSNLTFAAAPAYTITDLGDLGGGQAWAQAINQAGQVAGLAATNLQEATVWHAFRWNHGTMTDLGTLPGGTNSSGAAINDRGQVAGGSDTASGQNHAVLWSGGSITDLGTLPGGTFSWATGVNNLGQVVGYCDTASGEWHGFLWSHGTMTDLGMFWPMGINDRGQAVGSANTASGGALWSHGTLTDLGTLPGGRVSGPSAINARGQVVGWGDTADSQVHAILWERGAMIDLGTLAGGDLSQATAINDLGQVVGPASTATTGGAAFVYSKATGMVDLSTLLPPDSGWLVPTPSGINNRGQIVGIGFKGGFPYIYRRAVLLTPVAAQP
jgi:probable HAF family extracellular repeat protein